MAKKFLVDVDVNNNTVSNVATPVLGGDAVNKDYIDESLIDLLNIGEWTYNTTITAPPATGTFRLNNATPASATETYIHYDDSNGFIADFILSRMKVGHTIMFQQANDSDKWSRFEITSTTDNTTYFTYGVTHTETASAGFPTGLCKVIFVEVLSGSTSGIYSGSGTVPSTTAVTVTDTLNFDSNTFVIDGTNNRVGIGTNTPQRPLEVVGISRFRGYIGIDHATESSRRFFFTNGDDFATYASGSIRGTEISIWNSATEVLSVKGNNVGVGVPTPLAKFHVDGSIRFDGLTTTAVAGYVLQSTNASGDLDWVDVTTLFTDTHIGNSDLTISAAGTRKLIMAGALTTDIFAIRNSADSENLFKLTGKGEIQIGDNAFDFTSTVNRIALVGQGNTQTAYNTASQVTVFGHDNDLTSYGRFNVFGDSNTVNASSGGKLLAMGYNNTVIGGANGTVGIGQNNNVAGNANIVIGYNNQTQYEKNYSVIIGSNLQANLAGNKQLFKIGYGATTTNLAQIDNSFEIYLNGTSNSDFFLGTNTNLVLSNNTTIVSGTHYEAAASNVLVIHNGTAPTTNIANAYTQYSADVVAGNAAPHFRTENGSVVKLYEEGAVTTMQGIADALAAHGLLASSTISTNVAVGEGGIYEGDGTVPTGVTATLTDTLTFGTNTLVIDETNNRIGINIAAPTQALEVVGKTILRTTGTATAHTDTDLFVTDATAAGSTAQIEILAGNNAFSKLKFADTDSYTVGAIDYSHIDNEFTFHTNATQQMVIDNSGNVGVGIAVPEEKLHVYGNTKLEGTTLGDTVLNIVGTLGQLFSITDSFTGDIFSVNDISGIPIMTVNSDEYVQIDGSLIINTDNETGLTTGTTTVGVIDETLGDAGYFDYHATNGTAMRSGTVMCVWNGSNVEYTETTTRDLGGSTSGLKFTVTISGGEIKLNAVITSGTWDTKVGIRII